LKRARRALYRLYYRIKYFPFARERRLRSQATATRGFVVLQLDALSHDDLLHAVRQGRAPRIRKLIQRDGWELRRYPAGLPSATPAAQAAIFHGIAGVIPAFRYYIKKERRVIVGSRPADVQHIRDRLPENGILIGGSSYSNIFDGGARRSAFTLAARRAQPFFEKMGGARLALVALLHPFRMARMLVAALYEYTLEEWNRLVSQLQGHSTHYWWYIPLLHIATDVVLRELQTLAVLLDVYLGVPAIYTTYNSYDEFAHHFGPQSRPAMASVRAMDRRVAEILRMLRRLPGRDYDVYILSDHGQTPSVPYRVEFGETLGDTIVSAARHGVMAMTRSGEYAPDTIDAKEFLIGELEHVSAESNLAVRAIGLRIGRWIRNHYGIFPLVAEVVREAPDTGLVVTYSSSLAHVYWTQPESPLAFDEIRADPDRRALYYFLVAHRGIGVVITRMLDGAHVESIHGRAIVTPAGEIEVLSGSDPLEHYAATERERRAVVSLVRQDDAGDFVLFGAWDPGRDTCICFDDQVGAHGAMGGAQYWPFLLTRPGLVPPDFVLDGPLSLHELLRRYRPAGEADPAAEAPAGEVAVQPENR